MPDYMEINPDFKEFLGLLNAHKIKYLIVGGYAVNYHGYPRYTKDMDIWVWLERENIDKLLKVLQEFGFGSLDLKTEDFLNPENIIQLEYPPYRIDLMTDIQGLVFSECYQRRSIFELSEINLPFLAMEDLIAAKKNTARLQDLADAEQLELIMKQIRIQEKESKGHSKQ
jgi:hypothetical protein